MSWLQAVAQATPPLSVDPTLAGVAAVISALGVIITGIFTIVANRNRSHTNDETLHWLISELAKRDGLAPSSKADTGSPAHDDGDRARGRGRRPRRRVRESRSRDGTPEGEG